MSTLQLSRLKTLRDVGQRILTEPERYPLNLDRVECGTYACLWGWYVRETGAHEFCGYLYEANEYFGIAESDVVELFSGNRSRNNHRTELARRLTLLDRLIAEREPTRDEIPASVRRIFEDGVNA